MFESRPRERAGHQQNAAVRHDHRFTARPVVGHDARQALRGPMHESRKRFAAVRVPVPVECALDRRIPEADVETFRKGAVHLGMHVVFGGDEARGAPGARHRACHQLADACGRESLCGDRGLSFAGLIQRRVRKLIALGAVSFRFAVPHEDETLARGRKRNRGGKLRDPFVAEKVTMGATGPKGSSVMILESSGTSVTTVGSKKKPWLPERLPPVWTLPPRFLASCTKLSIASSRRGLANGPIVVSLSRPSPSLIAFGLSVKALRKRRW